MVLVICILRVPRRGDTNWEDVVLQIHDPVSENMYLLTPPAPFGVKQEAMKISAAPAVPKEARLTALWQPNRSKRWSPLRSLKDEYKTLCAGKVQGSTGGP